MSKHYATVFNHLLQLPNADELLLKVGCNFFVFISLLNIILTTTSFPIPFSISSFFYVILFLFSSITSSPPSTTQATMGSSTSACSVGWWELKRPLQMKKCAILIVLRCAPLSKMRLSVCFFLFL